MANGNGNGTSAPICHLPPSASIPQPAAQELPSIPTPDGTIDGIMAALQALIQGYNMMTGQQQSRDGSSQQNAKNGKSRFTETGRQKKKIHVTNPDDKTQFVDVEVVSHLTLTDKVTGETWDWTL